MKKIFFLTLLSAVAFLTACDKDDDTHTHDDTVTDFDYHAHIHSPDAADKHVGDTIALRVDFESHTGEPVHHIKVRIYNKSDSTEVYNKPDEAHIHETGGKFEFQDEFILSNENGVMEHTDWILEAKVWGLEAGVGEVTETVGFHVHP